MPISSGGLSWSSLRVTGGWIGSILPNHFNQGQGAEVFRGAHIDEKTFSYYFSSKEAQQRAAPILAKIKKTMYSSFSSFKKSPLLRATMERISELEKSIGTNGTITKKWYFHDHDFSGLNAKFFEESFISELSFSSLEEIDDSLAQAKHALSEIHHIKIKKESISNEKTRENLSHIFKETTEHVDMLINKLSSFLNTSSEEIQEETSDNLKHKELNNKLNEIKSAILTLQRLLNEPN